MEPRAVSGPLISPDELAQRLAGPASARPVVLDVRYRLGQSSGRADYEAGHVPGAAYVDVNTTLATIRPDGAGGRHPLPDPAAFVAGMRAAGVSLAKAVVVYDDWSSIAAARAWHLLRHYGHPDVRVLDGGWRAWRDHGHPYDTGVTLEEAGDFTGRPGALRILDAPAAAEVVQRGGVLVDARPANRFRGEDETVDPVAGHIPGAVSLPALSLVDEAGALRPASELRAAFAATGIGPDTHVVTYCGSGLQAAQAALAAVAAGLPEPGVYAGSWSDWITDPDRPIATGPQD